MVFWLIALTLAAFVAALVLFPLFRSSEKAETGTDRFDLQIYRDQLAAVETELERGVLTAEEAEQIRLEVSRRMLDADKAATAAQSAGRARRGFSVTASVAAGLLLLGGTTWLYLMLGAAGAPDQPLSERNARLAEAQANRTTQEEAEASTGNFDEMAAEATQSYLDLVTQLRETAATRPDDIRGQRLLVQHEARLGNFTAARIAKGNVIGLLGDKAEAGDFTDHAELMIIAAGGYVSPKAEQALGLALRLDPRDSRARYYSGLDLAQNGRPDLAYRIWSELLREGPEDAPWIDPIRQQIADVARMAGVGNSSPAPGPTEQQIEDAQEMTPEQQQEMIQSMVAQFSERLATEGGSPNDWARLIRAYGVLGETDKAAGIWAEAQKKFAASAEAMAEITAAAKAAGVAD